MSETLRNCSENVPIGRPVEFNVEDKKFSLEAFDIGASPEDGVVSPGLMETGKDQETMEIYQQEPLLVNETFSDYPTKVPYAFLGNNKINIWGDFTTPTGQDQFKDIEISLSSPESSFNPPDWAKELWEFAKIKQNRVFKTDETMACARELSVDNENNLVFKIGAGLYSQSFLSNGSEGIKIGLTNQEKEKLTASLPLEQLSLLEQITEKLVKQYGEGKTIREIIFSRYGHLPELNEQIHNNSIGVAGIVLTQKDKKFVFVQRGKNVSVNLGINCTASGAAKFNPELLSQYGLPHFLGGEMQRETKAELGLAGGSLLLGAMREKIQLELGLQEDDYNLIPVGFVRELPRGGKPECLFLIDFNGAAKDIVAKIIANPNAEKKEIGGLVYSQTLLETQALLKQKTADTVIQHKGLVNLMLILEYLKNI